MLYFFIFFHFRDQQQLRPNPSVYALGEYHNFNVSLFERLIVNDMPFTRLSHQRRMAPQIRSLVNPIYRNPPLMDHPYVHTYRSIPGMMQNLFFLIHNEPESHISESASKYNEHEAQMAVLLASYLIMQGIPPDMITILTMYSGQLRKLRECLRKERRMGEDINLVRISSVDGFQGEESEVVILSLVRSNSMGAIGFLKVVNRVCVALSRAKKVMAGTPHYAIYFYCLICINLAIQ
jgi:superfamily I DNA and/or RNA helicase